MVRWRTLASLAWLGVVGLSSASVLLVRYLSVEEVAAAQPHQLLTVCNIIKTPSQLLNIQNF